MRLCPYADSKCDVIQRIIQGYTIKIAVFHL